MTLWWIGDIVLLVVVVPVVVYLLNGVLTTARSIVPSVRQIATVAAAGSKDLDAGDDLVEAVRDLAQRQDRRDQVVDEGEDDEDDRHEQDDSGGGHG